mmetsp:Transcript_75581/g.213841  ORF Transcript_75581/g.213841 Transcript_75581/m.213841 type:complete len:224 (+) Transcript_75581:116-787(+)
MTLAWASSGRFRSRVAASCLWKVSRPMRWAQTARAKPRSRPRTFPSFVPRGSNSATMVSRTSCGSAARKWAPVSSRPIACAYWLTSARGAAAAKCCCSGTCSCGCGCGCMACSGGCSGAASAAHGQAATGAGRPGMGCSMDRAKACSRPKTLPSFVPRGLKLRITLSLTSSGRLRRKAPTSGPRPSPSTKVSTTSSPATAIMSSGQVHGSPWNGSPIPLRSWP